MRILYVTTTFPVYSETFLQREVRALKELGVELHIVSLHGGEELFDNLRIFRFSKLRLLSVPWLLIRLSWLKTVRFFEFLRVLQATPVRSWLNFWENLLGFGAALVMEREIRDRKPDLIHCVWASAPAAFGRFASLLSAIPYSMGAHAYDVFEFGGDWLLEEKAQNAMLIHTTTHSALNRLLHFVAKDKIRLIYRGMNDLPVFKKLRAERGHLRIVCIGRLVEKKGFPHQLRIYRALLDAGISFEARIIGPGPLRDWIETEVVKLGLSDTVSLLGKLTQQETLDQLQWADALFHTGVVAESGDRDGLPNVIPEAMSSGVIVVASDVSGVVEAISDEKTGFLQKPTDPSGWVEVCRRIQSDDALCEKVRTSARDWVDKNFRASVNSARLLSEMEKALESRNQVKLLETSVF